MAVSTVNPVITDVVFMAKRYGLRARHADFCDIRGFIDDRQRRHHREEYNDAAENRQSRDSVSAGMKNLSHSRAADVFVSCYALYRGYLRSGARQVGFCRSS